ncbi:MAG: hydantoinase/oxoprolinase family protein [Candidatus Tectomicrobia bacterium]|nr:hydantoinase/oxoprolinase family protein [Candidatus Tectomicrobia bacterium]
MSGKDRYRVGVDTGGTFTDVVVVHERTGKVFSTKVSSTPEDPSLALVQGIEKALKQLRIQPDQVSSLFHGTTVTTNALLQHKFEGLGLVVTRGFRFLLEIARQSVPDNYGNSYFWVKPDRIVPLHLVREVAGRLDPKGRALHPLDEPGARRLARWFRKKGVRSVAVCLLHAYANPRHERAVRRVFGKEYPEAFLSLSSDVMPEYREYERAMTTCMDAGLKPHIQKYVDQGEARVRGLLGKTPFLVMKSNGGVISARESARKPVATLLSGPAAGALAGAFFAERCGFDHVITFDAGGTSTDVSVVEGGEVARTTETVIESYPVKVPMIDIVTVGTGGGSIAWVSPEGRLKVGPQSAGAVPGPMCYARGGREPTVTDAAMVLGQIPTSFLGGEVSLNLDLAQQGVKRLADRLNLSMRDAAVGVLEIAAWNQAHSIRRMTVQRGRDPRKYALVAFGGAGPMMAGLIADILGMGTIIVPPSPGVGSAFGLQVVDLKNDYVRTVAQREDRLNLPALQRAFQAMEKEARADLDREGIPAQAQDFARSIDFRYFGEAQEMEIPLGSPRGARLTEGAFREAVEEFHRRYLALFRHGYRDETPVEIVNLRLSGVGRMGRPQLNEIPQGGPSPKAAYKGARLIYFKGAGTQECRVYAREGLLAGNFIDGPAVVEDYGSTTVILPGHCARVDRFGHLILTAKKGSRP